MTARTPTPSDLVTRRRPCRSCGAPVLWAITGNRKPMPVNPDPADNGNLLLELHHDEDGEQLLVHVLRRNQIPGARSAGQQLHTSHFTDCPRAAQHRKARR